MYQDVSNKAYYKILGKRLPGAGGANFREGDPDGTEERSIKRTRKIDGLFHED